MTGKIISNKVVNTLDTLNDFWHNIQAVCRKADDRGGVAQWLEHSAHTRGVAGSNPATATTHGALEKRLNSPAFHAGIFRGSNPLRVTKNRETHLGLSIFVLLGDSKGAVVNGVPGARQSRDPARPQAGESPTRHQK